MSVVLLCSVLPITALAAGPTISIPSSSSWQGSVFGDIGGAANLTDTNFVITENTDNGTVKLKSGSDKGKIASGSATSNPSEGLAYYYRGINNNENFELSAKATVNAWGATNNQISFGIMLRSNVLTNTSQSGYTGDYVALGALDQKMEAFYKHGVFNNTTNPVKKITTFTASSPGVGNVYDLSIKKSGNAYLVKIGNETQVIDGFTGNIAYAGLYTARNTTVTFSQVTFKTDTRAPSQLELDTTSIKTDYFVSDSLDLTGLKVTAVYPDNHEENLSTSDYVVSGFDNSKAGTNTITIHFNGQTALIPLNFKPLVVTAMDIKYNPVKTDYYLGEYFDPQGLTVLGQYNGGSNWAELVSSQYVLSIPVADATVTGTVYKFTSPGTKTVTVRSTVTAATYTTLDVTVKSAQMTGLEIRQLPQKAAYYIGDKFVQDGYSCICHIR